MRKLTFFAFIALVLAVPIAAQEILFDQMVEAAGLKCYPIQGDPTTWYYLPDKAHLVTDADGNPEFSFLMYVTPTKQGESGINQAPGGGIVHFLVAYDVPPDQVRRAQTEVARKKPNAKLVGPVSYVEGTFVLDTTVADPQGGFSRRVVGVGNAPLMAGHKAAVSIHLTPEGASLLWENFKMRTSDISVKFEMTMSGYRNPVEAAMSIDWQKVNQTMQIEAAGRYSFVAAEVDVMLQKMRNNGAIKVELKGAPPSQWNDIQSLGLELARQYLFESQGASGLAGLGAAGTQQSPLDRLWKLYGDEWKQQQKTSDLGTVRPKPPTGFTIRPVQWVVPQSSPPGFLYAKLDGTSPLALGRAGGRPARRVGSQVTTGASEVVLAANHSAMLTAATPNYWPQVFENLKRGEELLRDRRCTEALVAFRNARFNVILQLGYEPEQAGRAAGMQLYVTAREAMAAVCANQPTAMMEALTAFGVAARQVGRSTLAARGETLRDSLQATSGQASLGQQEEVDRQVTDINRRSSRAGAAQHPRSSESEAMPEPRREAAALYDRGIEQYYDGQLHEAAQAFVDAIKLAPDCADCFYNLAIIAVELGQRDAALNYLDRLFEARPDYGGIVFMRNARDAIAGTAHPIPPERRTALAEYLAAMDATTQSLLASSPGTTTAASAGGSGEASPKPAIGEIPATSTSEQTNPPGVPFHLKPFLQCNDAQARQLIPRMALLYQKGQFQDALALQEQINTLCPRPEFRYNLALMHILLGHRQPCLDNLDKYTLELSGLRDNSDMRRAVAGIGVAPDPIPQDQRVPLWRTVEAADRAFAQAAAEPPRRESPSTASQQQQVAEAPQPGAAPVRPSVTPAGRPSTTQATATATPGRELPGLPPLAAAAGAAAAGAGATPTRTPTRATPTATPKPEKPTTWGVIASFKLRRIESTGAFNLNLKQWLRTDQAVRFAANIGDLSGLMNDPRYFRRVNLDDPVFKQREIPVSVDVRGEDAFTDMLNAVTVTLKKRHESGNESLGEVTISRAEFASGKLQTLLYGWDQDNNRTRWLDYEVRERWNYVGGPVIETPWKKTSAGALVLEPPLRPRALVLEADPMYLQTQGVRDVVVEVHYRAGDADRIATATVRAAAPSGETRLQLYQDPQQPGYTYSYTWRLRGGDRRAAGPFTDTADIIYLDEVPPGS
jgi:tetratricopeptide (TPR) repeat protein